MTATDTGLMPLVLQLGRARAAAMDVPAVLASVCSAMPSVLGIGGAVLLLVEPPDGVGALTGSDARARWFGEAQQRADHGPLPGAVRTWRPMLTADLTRIGPATVAAAAAECGLTSSLVLPFDVDGDRLGVLQLLGEATRPVEAAHAEMLRPLLDALAARLADVRALYRLLAEGTADKATPSGTAVPVPRSPDGDRVAAAKESPAARPVPERDVATPGRRRATAGRSVESASSSTARRARGGASHSVPDGASAANSSESTTRALPAVPSGRTGIARAKPAPRAEPTSSASGPESGPTREPPPVARRRTGRHSA